VRSEAGNLSEEDVTNLNISKATRAGLNLLALIGVVVALRWGESILVPTVIAALLAALLWPAAQWLNRRCHIPWGIACSLVVTAVVAINLVMTLGFTLAITKIVQDLPDPRTPLGREQLYRSIRQPASHLLPDRVVQEYFSGADHSRDQLVDKSKESKTEAAKPGEPEPAKKTPAEKGKEAKPENGKAAEPEKVPDDPALREGRVFGLLNVALNPEKGYIISILWNVFEFGYNWLWKWVLIMFILLFLMLEGRMLIRRVVEIFGPSEDAQSKAAASLNDMTRQVRTYLVWRTIVNFGLGLIVGIVYHALTLHHAWTWALLTAVLCYIPYIGPIVAGVPPLFDAFVNCPDPWWVVGILVFYVALITLEGYIVVPVVMGRSMEMNATTVMLACLFWELVWGLPGLFLAMPLMAAVKVVCAHVPGWGIWANLMSTSAAETVAETRKPLAPVIDSLEDTQLITVSEAEALARQQPKVAEGK
jgi:AI-2 transport protein TqsA